MWSIDSQQNLIDDDDNDDDQILNIDALSYLKFFLSFNSYD